MDAMMACPDIGNALRVCAAVGFLLSALAAAALLLSAAALALFLYGKIKGMKSAKSKIARKEGECGKEETEKGG